MPNTLHSILDLSFKLLTPFNFKLAPNYSIEIEALTKSDNSYSPSETSSLKPISLL